MKHLILALCLSISISASAAKLKYATQVDLNEHVGQTYFSLMRETIKPALDHYAEGGFRVVTGAQAVAALSDVDGKVSQRALRAAGGAAKLRAVTDAVYRGRRDLTFYELPA